MARSRVVWLAALVAALGRFPSAIWPLRPDEAGFLLVARSWQPTADSMFGHYFVDRPPQIIAVLRLMDWIGGPYFHRLLGPLACALLVLAAAAAAREIARHAGIAEPHDVRRVAGWTAVVTAGLVTDGGIDPIAVKGELLGIPLVMAACWLALRAVRLQDWRLAFAGGLVAALPLGLKQSLLGGLVMGGVVLVVALVAGRIDRRTFTRLALAASAGALVPVVATIGWALAAGVDLQTLSYTVIGFRSDASEVLSEQRTSEGASARVTTLVLAAVGSGMVLVAAWFVARLPRLLRRAPVPTIGVLALVVVDVVGVVVSGSYWLPYLFALVPGLSLATACVLAGDRLEDRQLLPRATQFVVVVVALQSVVSLVIWAAWWMPGRSSPEFETGRAIAAAAAPGDTLTVFGGRPDIQWASGLPSPYPYLWSLPMRTLDPSYAELRALLAGPDAPTWIVEAVRPGTWAEPGVLPLEKSLLREYQFVGTGCDGFAIYHLDVGEDGTEDVTVQLQCDRDFRFVW